MGDKLHTLDLCALNNLNSINTPKEVLFLYIVDCNSIKCLKLGNIEVCKNMQIRRCKELDRIVSIPETMQSVILQELPRLTIIDVPKSIKENIIIKKCDNLQVNILQKLMNTFSVNYDITNTSSLYKHLNDF